MAAEDTLKAKTQDGRVVSGGHLVAKALGAEGDGVRHERGAALVL
jgi:hypothetical protein